MAEDPRPCVLDLGIEPLEQPLPTFEDAKAELRKYTLFRLVKLGVAHDEAEAVTLYGKAASCEDPDEEMEELHVSEDQVSIRYGYEYTECMSIAKCPAFRKI